AYVALFLAVIVGMMFVRQGDNDRRGGGVSSAIGYALFRVLADALFWTFHPFSPLAVNVYEPRRRRVEAEDKTPFYEKVNRFVFGPTPPKEEPRANERRILAEIRANKGRIGLADVMRVTGLPREEADPLMARLMLDYDGEVAVSEEGGIIYRFEAMRMTAGMPEEPPPPAAGGPPPRPAAAPRQHRRHERPHRRAQRVQRRHEPRGDEPELDPREAPPPLRPRADRHAPLRRHADRARSRAARLLD